MERLWAKSTDPYNKGEGKIRYTPLATQPRIGFGEERWMYRDPADIVQEVVVDGVHVATFSGEEAYGGGNGQIKLYRMKRFCPFWIWNLEDLRRKRWKEMSEARAYVTAAIGNAIIRGDDKNKGIMEEGKRQEADHEALSARYEELSKEQREVMDKITRRRYDSRDF